MKVFHYCASVLTGTPLFETCSDKDLKSGDASNGAIYNDFDNDPTSLLLRDDFNISLSDSDSDSEDNDYEEIENELEKVFLRADDEDPDRWIIDHDLFDNESEIDSDEYKRKVKAILSEDWDDLPIFHDHEQR